MGSKKKTLEEVRKAFEKEGYTLLTNEYINNSQKLEYICPKGHRGTIIWSNWKRGHRCAECVGLNKKSIDFIRQEFKKEGYKLLTTIYINNKQKLEYICPKKHEGTITWSSWQKGARCLECSGSKKKDINSIRQKFEKEGYKLLTKEYKNNFQKLEYICSNGHKWKITLNDWNTGYRCAICAGNAKKNISFIKKEFEKEGYQLLTKKYINSKQKLEYICPKKHKYVITWQEWNAGCRCAICAGKIKKDIDYIRNEFKKAGYLLLTTTYINNRQKLEYVCSEGHKSSSTWSNWKSGHRCCICKNINLSGCKSPRWKDYSEEYIESYKAYKVQVTRLSNHNYTKYKSVINPNKLLRKRGKYQLDHIYSIMQGNINNVHPKVISSPVNLQMLTEEENNRKRDRSDMTKEMLYDLYYQFEKEIKSYEKNNL